MDLSWTIICSGFSKVKSTHTPSCIHFNNELFFLHHRVFFFLHPKIKVKWSNCPSLKIQIHQSPPSWHNIHLSSLLHHRESFPFSKVKSTHTPSCIHFNNKLFFLQHRVFFYTQKLKWNDQITFHLKFKYTYLLPHDTTFT